MMLSCAQTTIPLSEDYHTLCFILSTGAIVPHFQPVFDLSTGDLIGHEALSRGPKDSLLHMPDKLFKTAIASGKLHELELLCRERSLASFSQQQLPGKLFLNISASLLSSSDHQKGMTLAMLQEMNIQRDRIVIELSEQHPYDHYGLCRASVDYYRRMGFNIAIDDLGVGYSGLRMWSELQPEYVKIDKHFIHKIDQDTVKREFVRSIVAIAQGLHCKVIAEGIETPAELDMLLELGIHAGQGFLLGYPVEQPDQCQNKLIASRVRRLEQKNQLENVETVLSLSRTVPTVSTSSELGEVDKIFKKHPELLVLPVVKGDAAVGVVRRADLLELFSTQYGRALYEHKGIDKLISKDVIIVESHVSLAKVSQQLTNQDANSISHEIIIVQDGCYLGMGSLRDLLKRITDLKIQNATYANPLTFLPGSVPINREIDRRLRLAQDFKVAYFDLNDFKPYNDYYGYAKGDEVIRLLGSVLKNSVTHSANFIGHIGGDDFVVIFDGKYPWQTACGKVLEEFAERVREHYTPKDIEIGGLLAVNRTNEEVFHNILSLAIGVVEPDAYACENYHEIAELAAQAKREAKKMGGNALFISRRRKLRM
jgi:diguanylate cyclase (GGDEF)-like protein